MKQANKCVVKPQKTFVKKGILISRIIGLYKNDTNKPNQKDAQTGHKKGLLKTGILAMNSLNGFIIAE